MPHFVSSHAEDAPSLTIRPLTPANFAPFGEVIELSSDANRLSINSGNCVRHNDLARPIAMVSGALSSRTCKSPAARMDAHFSA